MRHLLPTYARYRNRTTRGGVCSVCWRKRKWMIMSPSLLPNLRSLSIFAMLQLLATTWSWWWSPTLLPDRPYGRFALLSHTDAAGKWPCTLTLAPGLAGDPGERAGASPLISGMLSGLHEVRETNKKPQIWSGQSHWLKVVLKQGSTGLVLGKQWRCILPNDCLNFKYQVFIQQSSHTVGLWFIWLGYLPERNNLTSSNSCDFSASLIKTPIFRYFVSSHTPHPH